MKTTILGFLICLASIAEAGPRVIGNGGRAVICKNIWGDVASVQLLDIYEMSSYGLSTGNFTGLTYDQLLARFGAQVDSLRNFAPGTAEAELRKMNAILKLTKPGQKLVKVPDSNEAVYDEKCEIQQLANYRSDLLLLVDGEYWQKMDALNRAGLILHEWVYKTMRAWGDTESTQARKIVSHLLSDQPLRPVLDGLPNGEVLRCSDRRTEQEPEGRFDFVVTKDCSTSPCQADLHFRVFNGRIQFAKALVRTRESFGFFEAVGGYSYVQGEIAGQAPVESPLLGGETVRWTLQLNGENSRLFMTVSGSARPAEYVEVACGRRSLKPNEMLP